MWNYRMVQVSSVQCCEVLSPSSCPTRVTGVRWRDTSWPRAWQLSLQILRRRRAAIFSLRSSMAHQHLGCQRRFVFFERKKHIEELSRIGHHRAQDSLDGSWGSQYTTPQNQIMDAILPIDGVTCMFRCLGAKFSQVLIYIVWRCMK